MLKWRQAVFKVHRSKAYSTIRHTFQANEWLYLGGIKKTIISTIPNQNINMMAIYLVKTSFLLTKFRLDQISLNERFVLKW